MASNVNQNYVDRTPAAALDKKTLNKMAWRSVYLQGSFNFERMQANGWLYGILPGLTKIHTNKEDLSLSMTHNLEFFNTHPFLVTFVMGIILSLEQQKADVATIRAVRVAAMGPLGGIGDAIFWFTLVPIAASVGSNLALQGNIAGPIVFLLMFNVVQFALRYWLMHWSYKMGTSAIGVMTANAKEFTRAATVLGTFVVGALVAAFGKVNVILTYQIGESTLEMGKIIDGIMPRLLPMGLVFLLFWLIKSKGWSPVRCILLLLVIGLAGAFFGILGA
ncbi:MAG: PTS system mannose/fructose/sorbose family transporter subunit IID [Erysipelotrichaceae bacterium]